MSYSFVTVSYDLEVRLLEFQARSMARYLSPEIVDCIIVIYNSPAPMRSGQKSELLQAYGPLSGYVDILHHSDVCALPAMSGWRSQQILKLEISRQIGRERYVALDAKNHLVYPLLSGFLTSSDGRARNGAYSYEHHPLRQSLERAFEYVGLDPQPYIARFPATTTPFTLETDVVRTLMDEMEAKTGRSFAREFAERLLTEFLLYNAYLSKTKQLEKFQKLGRPNCPVIWESTAHETGVTMAIDRAIERETPFFALHRRSLPLLQPEAQSRLADFYVKRSLFDTKAEALEFLRSLS